VTGIARAFCRLAFEHELQFACTFVSRCYGLPITLTSCARIHVNEDSQVLFPYCNRCCIFFSMKKSRLSLNRDRCDKVHHDRNEVVEITDDESSDSDSSFDPREKMQREKYSCVRNSGMTVPNDVACVPSAEPSTTNTLQQYELSDDASTDENVVVINDVPMTSNRSKSMFNWDKTNLTNKIQNNLFLKDDTLHDSRMDQPEGACNKRQKLMSDMPENDAIDSKEFKKEPSLPEVTIQYEKMIGGIKVKFPVNPYPCQIGIVNSVSIMLIL